MIKRIIYGFIIACLFSLASFGVEYRYASRLVFIKDFSIRRLPFLEVKSALDKFENEVKDSEEFKTKILEEYYCVVIENQSEK